VQGNHQQGGIQIRYGYHALAVITLHTANGNKASRRSGGQKQCRTPLIDVATDAMHPYIGPESDQVFMYTPNVQKPIISWVARRQTTAGRKHVRFVAINVEGFLRTSSECDPMQEQKWIRSKSFLVSGQWTCFGEKRGQNDSFARPSMARTDEDSHSTSQFEQVPKRRQLENVIN
jgi:hypothetical protein